MANATVRGQGRPQLRVGHGDSRRGDVDTGLPVQPLHEEGSERSTALWNDEINRAFSASLRDDDGGSAAGSERQAPKLPDALLSGGLRPSDDGNGGDDFGGEEGSLSGLEKIEHAKLPDVSNGYRRQVEEAIASDTADGLRRQFEVLEADPNKLDAAVDLALNTAIDILELEYLPTSHTDYYRQLTLKKDTLSVVINAGLKADENRFRRKQHDVVAKLFAIARADKKLGPIIDQQA